MKNIKLSLGIRMLIIGFLTLVLLIPSLLIQDLIRERENRRDTVADEISSKWGGSQTITGPVLSIPYRHTFESNGQVEQTVRYAHFLPENLSIEGKVTPELRYRGIYSIIVYNTRLRMKGHFPDLDLSGFKVPQGDFMPGQAFISLGLTDMAGIREFIRINWNEREYQAEPGIETRDVLASGISLGLSNLDTDSENTFELRLNLNGSKDLLFVPVGKETHVQLDSDWPDPSFTGNFLPEQREVSPDGFKAEWKVLHLNRNFPQQWLGERQELDAASFGVNLLMPVDDYQKTMRTAKYAIMFISLTFLTFFMIELLSRKVMHPVQYVLIGFALLIFYTLLLSVSEYIAFGSAYLIAASAIIGMISIYSHNILADKLKTAWVSGVLVILYGYLYILLQLQDFALLLGSIGLFVVLALVMYLTRNINWFEVLRSGED